MNSLTIIRGLPGSGKSTLARNKFRDSVHFDSDTYMCDADGSYRFVAKLLPLTHGLCKAHAIEALSAGENVVVANTFTTIKEMLPYFEMAKEYGVDCKVYKCCGEYGSVHEVPASVIKRMKSRWQDLDGEIMVN